MKVSSTVLSFAAAVAAHGDHGHQEPLAGPLEGVWYNTLPGDGGKQVGLQRLNYYTQTVVNTC
jgi:agmatinase